MSSAALTCPPSRHGDVVVTLLSLLPGAVNSTANVLDIMQDNDDDERYTPVTVTESPAATIPAEPSAGMTGARSFRSFEDARAYVRTLNLKSKVEWNAWRKSRARPHDIPSTPHVTYASSGWLSYVDFLGFAGGKVTGAYKRNAAAAGLRALLDGADNDEKGEQDGDDEDARRRKQAKRPRGG